MCGGETKTAYKKKERGGGGEHGPRVRGTLGGKGVSKDFGFDFGFNFGFEFVFGCIGRNKDGVHKKKGGSMDFGFGRGA